MRRSPGTSAVTPSPSAASASTVTDSPMSGYSVVPRLPSRLSGRCRQRGRAGVVQLIWHRAPAFADVFHELKVPLLHHFPAYGRIFLLGLSRLPRPQFRIAIRTNHLIRQLGRIVGLEIGQGFFAKIMPD